MIPDFREALIRFVEENHAPMILCDENLDTLACNASFERELMCFHGNFKSLFPSDTLRRLKDCRKKKKSTSVKYESELIRCRLAIGWIQADPEKQPYLLGTVQRRIVVDLNEDIAAIFSAVKDSLLPMRMQINNTGMIRRLHQLDEDRRTFEAADLALNCGFHVLRNIMNIKSTMDALMGHFDLQNQIVDMHALLRTVIRQCKPLIEDRHIQILTEFSPMPIDLSCDCEQITRAVTNCLVCALLFAQDKTTISVHAYPKDDMLHITIIDLLYGVPENFWKDILTHDVPTPMMGKTTGLYFANLLIERHRGKLYLEKADCLGSAIHIELPLMKNVAVFRSSDYNPQENMVEFFADMELTELLM